MSEKICGIYKITNLINGKVYIGQSQDIYRRWKEHKYARNKRDCSALYGAFNKYGFENFSFEIIECCPLELLNEREIYYISLYHSYIDDKKSNGYNMTKGGALCFTHVGDDDQGRRVYQYDLEGSFVAEYRNCTKAAKAVGLKSNTSICTAIKKQGCAGDYQWRDYKAEKIEPFVKHRRDLLKVYQYTLDGDFIQEFNSVQEAADAVNCSRSLIELCGAEKCQTGAGYRWNYKFYEKLPKLEPWKQPSKWRPVYQYDTHGNFIAEYPCAEIASKRTNISMSAIRHCLHEDCKTAYGFVFKYSKEGG